MSVHDLIAIDMTLAGLFWAMAGDEDILARLIKKTLYIGFFAFLIGNFNSLCKIIFESFSGLGLKAAGSGLSAQTSAARPSSRRSASMPASRSSRPPASLMGYVSFFANVVQIFVLMVPG